MQTSPNDYLRVNIDHPSLDSPVWLEFTRSKNLDEDKILNKIEGVQQSKKKFLLTDGASELDFFHVKYPEGSGCSIFKHLHLDKEKIKKSKRAIVQINNPWDFLCLPRAIVVARLHAQKPEHPDPDFEKKWIRMRKGDHDSLDQKRQALTLMESAGCDKYPTLWPGGMGKITTSVSSRVSTENFPIQSEYPTSTVRTPPQGVGPGKMFKRVIRQPALRCHPLHAGCDGTQILL
jgi:hypothetical protein